MQTRRALALQTLQLATVALDGGAAQRATGAQAVLGRERLERAGQAYHAQGRLIEARRALDELIDSDLPDPDAKAAPSSCP